jgi:excisionase family DNA binding protein
MSSTNLKRRKSVLTVVTQVPRASSQEDPDTLVPGQLDPAEGLIDLRQIARTPLLTLAETATLLRVSKDTLRSWLIAGTIKGRRIGHEWRIPSGQFSDIIPTADQANPLPGLPLAVGQ